MRAYAKGERQANF